MASILKRPGPKGKIVWQVQIRKKGYAHKIKTFDRKADAQSWATMVEHKMETGSWKDTEEASGVTFWECIERYLKDVSPKKEPSTQRSERRSTIHLRNALGNLSLMQVTPERVAAYRDDRLKKAASNTVRIELALLSNLFNVAAREWGFHSLDNPVKKIPGPKLPEGRSPIISEEQISELLEECKQSNTELLYPFVLLALHTGCRSMELRGLRWSQVNLHEGYISLVGAETKGDRSRGIPLTQIARETLKELTGQQKFYKFRDPNGNPAGLIFPSRSDSNNPRDMHMSFNRAVKRAGLDQLPGVGKLRIHDLRHLCGSFLVMKGVDIETIKNIMGHKDITTTQRYLHVVNQHKKNAIDKIGHLGIITKNAD